jgi:hypothetical protein
MLDAQYIDLQKILCPDFYYEITENPDLHLDLLDGSTYTDHVSGLIRRHEGLRAVVALFSYARYIRWGSNVSTAYDLVQKTNEYSQPINGREKQISYVENRKIAMSYFDRVRDFLNDTNYPGWDACCKKDYLMTEWKLNTIEKR